MNVAILGLESFARVQEAFARTKSELGEILSAFEFWDRASLELVRSHLDVRDPLGGGGQSCPFYVLIETAGSHKEHDDDKLSALLETLMENGIVQDGAVAQDGSQLQNMWNIREGIPEACSKAGVTLKVGRVERCV